MLKSRYNKEQNRIDSYYTNPNITIQNDVTDKIPIVLTGQILQTLEVLRKWLLPNNEEHFLLVGPHGCAKS